MAKTIMKAAKRAGLMAGFSYIYALWINDMIVGWLPDNVKGRVGTGYDPAEFAAVTGLSSLTLSGIQYGLKTVGGKEGKKLVDATDPYSN